MVPVTAENAAAVAQQVKAGVVPGPAKSLAEAMARVMEQVDYVQKTGVVTVGQGYKFAGEAAFIAKIRPELVKQSIVVCPVDMQPLFCEVVQGKSGSQNRVVLRVTFRFTHAPSGNTLDVVTCGEGIDSGDKATNKAMTGAMKYALRQAFVIETGNDPDETPSEQQQRVQQPQAAGPPQANDNPQLRAKCAAAIGGAKTRDELTAIYRQYDADVKAGTLGHGDKAALDPLFKEAAQRFPKPQAAAK